MFNERFLPQIYIIEPKTYANEVDPMEFADIMIPINVKSKPACLFANTG